MVGEGLLGNWMQTWENYSPHLRHAIPSITSKTPMCKMWEKRSNTSNRSEWLASLSVLEVCPVTLNHFPSMYWHIGMNPMLWTYIMKKLRHKSKHVRPVSSYIVRGPSPNYPDIFYVDEIFCIWDILINMQIKWIYDFVATHINSHAMVPFLIVYQLMRRPFYGPPGVIMYGTISELTYLCKFLLCKKVPKMSIFMLTVHF